jgi:phosphoenolpyruvate carboxykinase (GTP)
LQSFNWTHGVYLGATMGSETTAAATGKVGVVRRDPMAMLPFCGYSMGHYFGHWLDMQNRLANPPKIFQVNWFRQGADGSFLWPGFGENMRVLKWVIDRANGRVGAQETLFGWVPKAGHVNLTGLDLPPEQLDAATAINPEEWKVEFELQTELFDKIAETMPRPLVLQRELLMSRLEPARS